MYIGSLIKNNTPVKCEYSYRVRGTSVPLMPDYCKEEYDLDVFTKENGKLFLNGPIGWKTDVLLDVGVDIVFRFEKECFIDHVILKQEENSAFRKVEIIKNEEHERKIGFYNAQTGKNVDDDEIKIDVGYYSDNLIIRVYSAVKEFVIKELDIYGALFDEDMLFPVPEKRVNISEEQISVTSFSMIVTTKNSDICYAASLLKEKLKEIHNVDVSVSEEENTNCIVFKEFGKDNELYNVKESFGIITGKDKITIYANDKRGFIYGAESLILMITDGKIPHVEIMDKPSKEFRGMHIYSLPERKDLDFFMRYIKYMLVPLRYNAMVLEVCGGMRYESHPEITEKWVEACEKYKRGEGPIPSHSGCVLQGTVYEKSEVAKIVREIKELGIEVIPEVQSLGHVQYLTNAFPEIAEIGTATKKADYSVADNIPDDEIPHNYCVSNPKTYEIMFDILDEIIEVFKPERYVHMGHDEVSAIGVCPLCREKSPGDLLAHHLNTFHGFLKERGLKMMIWSDMLQNVTSERTPYLHLDTMSAIAKISKDIVMCDFIWYFNLDRDIEDHLIKNGFEVVIGNLYSSLYPRYDSRIAKKGMLGGLSATWVDTNEYAFARDGKMYEAPYISNMLWSDSYESDNRLSYNECVKKLIPFIRRNIRNEKKKENAKNISLESTVSIPYDIRKAGKEYNLKEMIYVSGNEESIINVNDKAKTLAFLHATEKNTHRICWVPLVVIGEYVVRYEDDTCEIIPIEYGGNICELRRGYAKPLNQPYYRHQGYLTTYIADPEICSKTDNGDDLTIYRYEWKNPKPDMKIKDITVKKYDNTDADIMLFAINGMI